MTKEEKYKLAKQDFANVCKGGKDYAACSFMDISIRSDRFEEAKKQLIEELGKAELKRLEEEGQL